MFRGRWLAMSCLPFSPLLVPNVAAVVHKYIKMDAIAILYELLFVILQTNRERTETKENNY